MKDSTYNRKLRAKAYTLAPVTRLIHRHHIVRCQDQNGPFSRCTGCGEEWDIPNLADLGVRVSQISDRMIARSA